MLSPNERAQKRMEQQRRDYKKNRPFVVPFERYWYKDFLWKIAFSNRLTFQSPTDCPIKFKAYIGPGNNSLLVKSLIKRRNAWWTFTDRIDEAHLVWTQIKVNDYFQLQKQHIQIVKEVKNDQ